MARSFSNVKSISALVADEISNAVFRTQTLQLPFPNMAIIRGYAAAVQTGSQATVRVAAAAAMKKNTKDETAKVSWIPDPKTGYYRPENGADEIDPAELRATLLNKHHGNKNH